MKGNLGLSEDDIACRVGALLYSVQCFIFTLIHRASYVTVILQNIESRSLTVVKRFCVHAFLELCWYDDSIGWLYHILRKSCEAAFAWNQGRRLCCTAVGPYSLLSKAENYVNNKCLSFITVLNTAFVAGCPLNVRFVCDNVWGTIIE